MLLTLLNHLITATRFTNNYAIIEEFAHLFGQFIYFRYSLIQRYCNLSVDEGDESASSSAPIITMTTETAPPPSAAPGNASATTPASANAEAATTTTTTITTAATTATVMEEITKRRTIFDEAQIEVLR